jgi:hypothetical protein
MRRRKRRMSRTGRPGHPPLPPRAEAQAHTAFVRIHELHQGRRCAGPASRLWRRVHPHAPRKGHRVHTPAHAKLVLHQSADARHEDPRRDDDDRYPVRAAERREAAPPAEIFVTTTGQRRVSASCRFERREQEGTVGERRRDGAVAGASVSGWRGFRPPVHARLFGGRITALSFTAVATSPASATRPRRHLTL